jgi:hypothetical protein
MTNGMALKEGAVRADRGMSITSSLSASSELAQVRKTKGRGHSLGSIPRSNRSSIEESFERSFLVSFQVSFVVSLQRSFNRSNVKRDEGSFAMRDERSNDRCFEGSFAMSFRMSNVESFDESFHRSFAGSFPASFPMCSEVICCGLRETRGGRREARSEKREARPLLSVGVTLCVRA